MRDPINSGLTRWRSSSSSSIVYLLYIVDIAGRERKKRSPCVSIKLMIQLTWAWRMGGLTRDATADPVSRDQILRHERGQEKKCPADHYFLIAGLGTIPD